MRTPGISISRRGLDSRGIRPQRKDERRASYSIFFDTPESFTARDWLRTPWGNQINLNAPAGRLCRALCGLSRRQSVSFPYPPNKRRSFPSARAYINFPLNLTHPTHRVDLSLQTASSARIGLVSATYIGDKGTHYRSGIEANPAQFVPEATWKP